MEGIIALHSDIWAIMLFVAIFVLYILYSALSRFNNGTAVKSYKVHHNSTIEIIWTTLPALLLCVIVIPSFTLLYSLDEIVDPTVTIKVIGRQWYWTYEYSDYGVDAESNLGGSGLIFDSYLLQDDMLEEGQLRLLEVDSKAPVAFSPSEKKSWLANLWYSKTEPMQSPLETVEKNNAIMEKACQKGFDKCISIEQRALNCKSSVILVEQKKSLSDCWDLYKIFTDSKMALQKNNAHTVYFPKTTIVGHIGRGAQNVTESILTPAAKIAVTEGAIAVGKAAAADTSFVFKNK